MAWEYERKLIANGRQDWRLLEDTGIPGTWALVATLPTLPYPACTLWLRWHDSGTLAIVNVYTIDPLRRCGLASWLLERAVFLSDAKVVYTQAANEMSGPWLVKNGFRHTRRGYYRKGKA